MYSQIARKVLTRQQFKPLFVPDYDTDVDDYLDDVYPELGVGDHTSNLAHAGQDQLAAVAADFAAEAKKLSDQRIHEYEMNEGIDGDRPVRRRRQRLAFERSALDTIAEEEPIEEDVTADVPDDRKENSEAKLAGIVRSKTAKVSPGTLVVEDLETPGLSGERLQEICAMFCVETPDQAAQRRQAEKDNVATDAYRDRAPSQSQDRKKSVKRRLIGWFRAARRFLLCQ